MRGSWTVSTTMRVALRTLASMAFTGISGIGCFPAAEPPMTPVTDHVAAIAHPSHDVGAHVYVRGEVGRPGRYTLLAPATALQVLDAAGGLSRLADPHIVITRRLDDGRVKRWVVEIQAVLEGSAPDDEVLPEDTLDVLGRLVMPPGVWVFSRPELPPITLKKPAYSCPLAVSHCRTPVVFASSE
jgi:hypothetical protein